MKTENIDNKLRDAAAMYWSAFRVNVDVRLFARAYREFAYDGEFAPQFFARMCNEGMHLLLSQMECVEELHEKSEKDAMWSVRE